jgi:hypothetical protein
MDCQDQRQDRHPPAQQDRSRALPGMDRQRPPTTTPHPTNAPGRGQSSRAEAQTSSQPVTGHASPQHTHTANKPRLAAGPTKPRNQERSGAHPRSSDPSYAWFRTSAKSADARFGSTARPAAAGHATACRCRQRPGAWATLRWSGPSCRPATARLRIRPRGEARWAGGRAFAFILAGPQTGLSLSTASASPGDDRLRGLAAQRRARLLALRGRACVGTTGVLHTLAPALISAAPVGLPAPRSPLVLSPKSERDGGHRRRDRLPYSRRVLAGSLLTIGSKR